jgi:hypothetical protein
LRTSATSRRLYADRRYAPTSDRRGWPSFNKFKKITNDALARVVCWLGGYPYVSLNSRALVLTAFPRTTGEGALPCLLRRASSSLG